MLQINKLTRFVIPGSYSVAVFRECKLGKCSELTLPELQPDNARSASTMFSFPFRIKGK